ncbi:MAG: hypothetical protein ACTJIB_12710 [Pseudoalteromonas prydzensis]|uniref:hypothetical protein n=1 Tax=Pseudoalteromonas prydzensis TaxID=182141 RepID=UPI003F9E4DAD
MIALSLFALSTFSTVTVSNTASVANAASSTDTHLTRGAGMILPPKRPKNKMQRGAGMTLPPIKPKVLTNQKLLATK